MLWNEIQALKTLGDNEYTIRLYEVYESAHSIYFVMEFLSGGTLLQKLISETTEKEVNKILKSLLNCIKFCHSKGLMHRDIKLDNLMFKTRGDLTSVKFIDFGLAQFFDKKDFILRKCGSPGFIAPEIFSQEHYSQKCDIFSAGVVAYTLLTKSSPFPANNEPTLLKMNKLCHIDF